METVFTDITDYLLKQSWQIAILFAVVAIICMAIRKKTAHLRYLLWLLIIAKCLVPSLITVSLAILPQKPLPQPLPESAPIREFAPPPESVILSEAKNLSPPAVRRPSIMAQLAQIRPKTWFSGIWLGGVSLYLLIVLIKAARFNRRLSRQRKPLTAGMQKEMDELLDRFGVHAKLHIWLLDGIGQPFVWGLLRGSIYLPANFGQIGSREHRRGILMHEITHVVRFDAAVNCLQTITQAVFWFHPLVWLANRNIRAEREKCCDETAIARLSAAPKVYSSAIVDTLIAEYQSTQPIPSLAIAGPIKNIEDRIKTIMKPGKKFYNRPTIIALITILLLAIAAVPTTIALTHRQAEKPEGFLTKTVVQVERENQIKDSKAARGTLSFGPVIVREIPIVTNEDDPYLTDCLIDLETGKLFKLPQALKNMQNEPEGQSKAYIGGTGLVQNWAGKIFLHLSNESWDSITPAELKSKLQREKLDESAGVNEIPATFGFKTLEGNIGLLQILGGNDEKMIIHYKMVAASAKSKPDVQVEVGRARPNNSLESKVNEPDDKYNQILEPLNRQHQELEKELEALRDAYDDTEHLAGVRLTVSNAELEAVGWLRKRYVASGVVRCEMPNQLLMQSETAIWPDSFEVHTARTAAYLKDRDFLQEVIRRDKVRRTKWFQARKKDTEKVMDSLAGSLTVQVKDTADIEVKFTAADPGDAQTILDELLQLFILRKTDQAQNELTKKMADLHEEKSKLKRSIQFMEDEKKTSQKEVQETQKPDVQVEDGSVRQSRHEAAVAQIEKLGGQVEVKTSETGEDYTEVFLSGSRRNATFNKGGEILHLYVDRWEGGDEGIKHLKGLANLKKLRIQSVETFTNEGMAQLKDIKSLESLTLVRTQVTDDDLIYLKNLTNLESLGLLSNSQITDKALDHLRSLTNLKKLRLDDTQVTDEGLQKLKQHGLLTGLELLALGRTQITDAGLAYLRGMSELKVLYMESTDVTDSGLAHLAGLTKLEVLILDSTQVTGTGLEHLKGLTNLDQLVLGGTKITDVSLFNLKGFTKLQSLFLENPNVTDAGLDHLSGLTSLNQLYLTGSQVSNDGYMKLKRALPNCRIYWEEPRTKPDVQVEAF
jgi:beta-lactamase regulating signal transducer with metallopeptidase domain